jgi:hypothetical protein
MWDSTWSGCLEIKKIAGTSRMKKSVSHTTNYNLIYLPFSKIAGG